MYAAQSEIPNLRASSAGTRAVTGHPIEHNAALVLESLGADPTKFSARQLTSAIAFDADLVLTMTTAHRDAVLQLAPQQLARTFTVHEAARLTTHCDAQNIRDLARLRPHLGANGPLDIPDPLGRGQDFFAMVGAQISALLPPILEVCRNR